MDRIGMTLIIWVTQPEPKTFNGNEVLSNQNRKLRYGISVVHQAEIIAKDTKINWKCKICWLAI